MSALMTGGAAQAQFIPTTSEHTLVAEKDVKIDDGAQILGDVHANEKVEVKKDASVIGDVSAGDEVKNEGSILGTVTEDAPAIDLPDFDEDDLRAVADRVFNDDRDFSGEIVDDIVFVDGKATIDGPVTGSGMILAADDILVDADKADLPGPTLVTVKDIKIEKDKGWNGVVIAGKNVKLEDNGILEGRAFAHDKVEIKKNAQVMGDAMAPPTGVQKPFVLVDPSSAVYRSLVALAEDEVKVDKDSVVTGNVHANDKVDIKDDALVDGDASAVDEVKNDGTVTGSTTEDADPVSLPALPSAADLRAVADRVFNDKITLRDETVDDVIFVFGKVDIEGSLGGSGTLIATDEIHFKGSPGAADPDAKLSLISYDDIKLDKDWTFRGALRAVKDVKLDKNTVVQGIAIAGKKVDIKKEVSLTFELLDPPVDLTEPELEILAPGPLVVGDSTPSIELTYRDDESGIDATTLRVEVDGVVLDNCQRSSQQATCTSPSLQEGEHSLQVEIANGQGLTARRLLEFRVLAGPDTVPPSVAILRPASGDEVVGTDVEVVLSYSDDRSGIALDSLVLTLDGGTVPCSQGETTGRCLLPFVSPGPHTLTAAVEDSAGNPASVTDTFTVAADGADTEPPTVEVLEPTAAIVYQNPDFQVTFLYSDALSGIAPDSVNVTLDGVDITDDCFVLPTGTRCANLPAVGNHAAQIEVRDRSGNGAMASVAFEMRALSDDDGPPILSIVEPEEGAALELQELLVELRFGDVETGIEESSLRLLLDGSDVTTVCRSRNPGSAECLLSGLPNGQHVLTARIADRADNSVDVTRSFSVAAGADTEGPGIVLREPFDPVVVGNATPEIVFSVGDTGSGIDFDSLQVLLDGDDLTPNCLLADVSSCDPEPLAPGLHQLEVTVDDLAGNRSSVVFEIEIVAPASDTQPPSLVFEQPAEGSTLVGTARPVLRLAFADDPRGAGLDVSSLRVAVDGVDITPFCQPGSTHVQCQPNDLNDGPHSADASIRDLAGNLAQASVTFTVQLEAPDDIRPQLTIQSPVGDVRGVAAPTAILTYSDEGSGVDSSSLRLFLDGAELAADCTFNSGGATCPLPSLGPGEYLFRAEVADLVGNSTFTERIFNLDLRLVTVIDEPQNAFLTREPSLTVRGMVSSEATRVRLGDRQQTVTGGSFEFTDVALEEGQQNLTVFAVNETGGLGSASVVVVRDVEAPRPVFQTPRDGAVTSASQITLVGHVVEASNSGAAQGSAEIEVNGLPAQVRGDTFMIEGFLLGPGENRITAVARDRAGNFAQSSITVVQRRGPGLRLEVVQGDGQVAGVGEDLAEPLVVRAVDTQGLPLAGRRITFETTRGDGLVTSFPETKRQVTVVTNEHGVAQVAFRLGTRAGLGNQQVTVTAPGSDESVVFCATAEPLQPERIKAIVGADSSGALRALAGQAYPQPLSTQVFDPFGNVLPDIQVTYEVIAGSGHFDGEASRVVTTDAEGKASVSFTLGSTVGFNNHVVRASFDGLQEQPATFIVSALAAGSEADTSFAGLVLDPQEIPVPNTTLRLRGLDGLDVTTLADAEGRFRFDGITPGPAVLEVEGSTVTRPGNWPHLEFHVDLLPGVENSLGKPIPLPQIDADGAVLVGGDQDVVIPLRGVPGGSLTVFANSVTMPNGSSTGLVSFTQIPRDRVPMVAPLGSSFMAAFSVQPPGVHFDPPARVSLPNLGAEPGSEVDVFSFDHDVFEFIKTGVASIEPDGSLMRSAPGLGIFESGWGGCVTPPVPNGNSCGFSTCLKCGPDGLEPRCDRQCETCDGKSAPLQPIVGEDGSLILAANKAACEPKELPDPKITVDGKEVEEGKTFYIGLEQEVEFAIKNGAALSGKCGELEYAWSYPVGMTDDGASFKAEFDKPGSKTINLTVSCKDCSSVDPVMASVDVEVVDFMIGGKFKIIENETDMTIETKDDKKFLRGFGGFRLKLEVGSLPAALKNEVKKYTWSEDKGKFFDGFGIKAKEISGDDLAGPMKTEIHWQGPWKVTMDIDVELELELNDGRKVKGKRRIENRVVVPTNKGDDVKIMTSYLRLMGFAAGPASDKTGTYGVNGSLSVTDTYTGDIRMAVIRMQKRDQISRDGKVGDEGLGRIEEHWKDYQTAYDAFSSDGKVLVTHPMFEDWLDAGLVVLNRSYTDALHTTLGGGSRKDLLRAWVKKEGGVGHWGTKVDYRVTLGAWDNRGSIGFSQIQNRYKYGDETKGDRSPGLKNVNLYHPKEAVEAIALWAVTPGLGPSFFKAFERKDWKHSTTWAVDEYPRVGKSTTPRAGTTFEDGVKEQLGKGLAGYNQGAGKPMHGFFRDNTWPEMLRDIVPKPPATVTQTDNELIAKKAIRYGITIQEAGMVSSVSYDWTDSVAILAGTDKKCASSATGDDIELATGDVDNENVVCVCAGPDKTLNSTRNAADEILEFEFVYGEVKWKAKKNWQDERNTAFDAKVAAISLNCMTPPATP